MSSSFAGTSFRRERTIFSGFVSCPSTFCINRLLRSGSRRSVILSSDIIKHISKRNQRLCGETRCQLARRKQEEVRVIERVKRVINSMRHGNPYGRPHSINVAVLGDLPLIPNHLAELAQQALIAVERNTGDDFDKLRLIYDYLDEYNQFVQTFSVCRRGCHYCCKIDIAVTKLEALYIQKQTGRQMHRRKKHSRNHRSVCPMLSADGTCGIYEYRPFNCRTFHTLDDPALCATPGMSHNVYGAEAHAKPYQSSCYNSMARQRDLLNRTNEVKDIRDYF